MKRTVTIRAPAGVTAAVVAVGTAPSGAPPAASDERACQGGQP